MAIKCYLPLRADLLDISGNSKDFTWYNTPTFVDGWPTGKCMNLNGSNQWAKRANDTDFSTQTFTFSIWANKTTTSSLVQLIFEKGTTNTQYYIWNPWWINIQRVQYTNWGGYQYFDINDSDTIWKWTKWVVRADSTNIKLFKNWIEVNSWAQWTIATDSWWEALGMMGVYNAWFFPWKMAKFFFDNSAQPVAQIKNDYAFDKGFI